MVQLLADHVIQDCLLPCRWRDNLEKLWICGFLDIFHVKRTIQRLNTMQNSSKYASMLLKSWISLTGDARWPAKVGQDHRRKRSHDDYNIDRSTDASLITHGPVEADRELENIARDVFGYGSTETSEVALVGPDGVAPDSLTWTQSDTVIANGSGTDIPRIQILDSWANSILSGICRDPPTENEPAENGFAPGANVELYRAQMKAALRGTKWERYFPLEDSPVVVSSNKACGIPQTTAGVSSYQSRSFATSSASIENNHSTPASWVPTACANDLFMEYFPEEMEEDDMPETDFGSPANPLFVSDAVAPTPSTASYTSIGPNARVSSESFPGLSNSSLEKAEPTTFEHVSYPSPPTWSFDISSKDGQSSDKSPTTRQFSAQTVRSWSTYLLVVTFSKKLIPNPQERNSSQSSVPTEVLKSRAITPPPPKVVKVPFSVSPTPPKVIENRRKNPIRPVVKHPKRRSTIGTPLLQLKAPPGPRTNITPEALERLARELFEYKGQKVLSVQFVEGNLGEYLMGVPNWREKLRRIFENHKVGCEIPFRYLLKLTVKRVSAWRNRRLRRGIRIPSLTVIVSIDQINWVKFGHSAVVLSVQSCRIALVPRWTSLRNHETRYTELSFQLCFHHNPWSESVD